MCNSNIAGPRHLRCTATAPTAPDTGGCRKWNNINISTTCTTGVVTCSGVAAYKMIGQVPYCVGALKHVVKIGDRDVFIFGYALCIFATKITP